MPKNTTQWPRLGLEPGPLDLESSALTMRPLYLYSVICCSIAILSNYILLYEAKQLHKVYTITSCIETATFYPKYYSSGHRMHASNVGFFCLLWFFFFFCFTGVLHPLEDFWDGTPNEYASDCPMSLYRSFLWNRTCTLTLVKFNLW